MNNAFLKSFYTLQTIYEEKAFSSITLNKTLLSCKQQDRALVTKIVYGVLDNDIKLSYVLSKYVKKMPKKEALIILKMGIYVLMELSSPVYAVVNDFAELAKITEDVRVVGFVNATLKNVSKTVKQFDDYPKDELERISVQYSYPDWAVKKLVKDYGKNTMLQIVSYKSDNSAIVRLKNGGVEQAKQKFGEVEPTCFPDAFSVRGKGVLPDETFTVQSLSSMAISRAVAACAKANVLDCCSAPGGKAIYVKQLRPDVNVVACDVHPHRVELINAYAKRMATQVETHCADMTVFIPEWEKKFDTVLCDVPCSGFGVLDNRPDIKLFRENKDISDLMKLQYAILCNCSNYVQPGGNLIYSTCTVFDNENGQNVRKFLKEHSDFSLGKICIEQLPQTANKSCYQFLPHKDGMQGFFLAVLERKG